MSVGDITANRHGGNPESEAAYRRIVGSLRPRARQVLAEIEGAGEEGLTTRELAAKWRVGMNVVSGRFSELKKQEMIRKTGVRDDCGVYVVVRPSEDPRAFRILSFRDFHHEFEVQRSFSVSWAMSAMASGEFEHLEDSGRLWTEVDDDDGEPWIVHGHSRTNRQWFYVTTKPGDPKVTYQIHPSYWGGDKGARRAELRDALRAFCKVMEDNRRYIGALLKHESGPALREAYKQACEALGEKETLPAYESLV
jgi:DNA-binding transcriptional regulator YhcF (GntR family)